MYFYPKCCMHIKSFRVCVSTHIKPIRLMSVPQIGSYVLGKAAGRESLIQANPNAQMYACIFNEHSYTSEHF